MEKFSDDGVFWIDGHEEVQLTGTLTFSAQEGVRLSLIGSLQSSSGERAADDSEMLRILGVAGNRMVTLVDASPMRRTFGAWPGPDRTVFRAEALLAGGHLGQEVPLEFEAVLISAENLDLWLGVSGLRVEHVESDGGVERIIHEFVPPPNQVAPLSSGGTVEVGFGWRTSSDGLTEAKLTQTAYVKVSPEESLKLAEAFEVTGAVRHLVALASTASCPLHEVKLWHPSVAARMDGRQRRSLLQLYARLTTNQESVKRDAADMLFSYEQLGGVQGVATWLSLAGDLRTVLGSLLSLRYSSSLYVENRLQNAAFAAESLHRIRWPNEVRPADEHERQVNRILSVLRDDSDREWVASKLQHSNEPRLRRRLQDLASFAGPAFKEFVGGDVKKWALAATKARNALNHYQESDRNHATLYYLAESLYVLVVLCLLRMAGASDESRSSAVRNQRLAWLAERIPGAVAECVT